MMGKISKAIMTGISTRRRSELKVSVLISSHDFFKKCHELDSLILCNDDWAADIDTSLHSIGRIIEVTAASMTFSNSRAELLYVKGRIEKYLITVLIVIIDGILRRHSSTFTYNWDDRCMTDNMEYYEIEDKILDFKKKSIKRLKLIV